MLSDKQFKKVSVGLIAGWLSVFALLPFLFVLLSSFLQKGTANFIAWHFSWQNYETLFQSLYFWVFLRSLVLAGVSTFICLLLGYPFAFILARMKSSWRIFLLLLILIPFWTSSLIRSYAIIAIIQADGILSHFLMFLGLIHRPLEILYTPTAVIIGLVYCLFPFMVLPLYANLEKFDWHLLDAAEDLGASKWQAYRKILLPLTVPGILAGVLLVLLPAMTLFYIPDLLGGARSLLLGNLIKTEFLDAQNWPLGSAVSVMLTILMGILLLIYWRFAGKKSVKTEIGI